MKKARSVICLLCMLVCFLNACDESETTPVPGLRYEVAGVPRIDSFSGEKMESEDPFPSVETAVYIDGSTEQRIEPNDPRLIRLLNFLLYSKDMGLSAWAQGYLDEQEISELQIPNFCRLEVTFSAPSTGASVNERTWKIIIFGDGYLQYSHGGPTPDWEAVEHYCPYVSLVMDLVAKNELPKEAISTFGLGTDYWIDLVKYAGF